MLHFLKSMLYCSAHLGDTGLILAYVMIPLFLSNNFLSSSYCLYQNKMSLFSCVLSGLLYLMRQRDHGCFCDRFVFALHEICEQFSFSFDINGSSSDETEAIFLQDVIAVLHHLRITNTITYVLRQGDV